MVTSSVCEFAMRKHLGDELLCDLPYELFNVIIEIIAGMKREKEELVRKKERHGKEVNRP